jgi:hypothetical protein
MKLFAIIILLFVTFVGLANNTKTEEKINIDIQLGYSDSVVCSKTIKIDLRGNVTKETSAKVIEYILNKKGICNATINLENKVISIEVVDDLDYGSIKGLVTYAQHLYLLEGSDPTTNLK